VIAAVVRPVLLAVTLVVLYFRVPLDGRWTGPRVADVIVGLAVVGIVVGWQVLAVVRSPHPRLRAVGALAATLPMVVVLFAASYSVMADDQAGAFSEPLSRVDALYFSLTVFSTVGFGDIVARSESARILVTVQILVDLVYVGLFGRAIIEAARIGERRRER
jgi:hypothetical protein